MKKNNGRSLITFILFILIFILIGFLLYEVFYMDIFDLREEATLANVTQTSNTIAVSSNNSLYTNLENIETIEPIINSNNMRK